MAGLDLSGIALDCQIEILNDRIQQLEVAIRSLHHRVVPPPNIFNGSQGCSIDYFFFLFERHCLSVYGED